MSTRAIAVASLEPQRLVAWQRGGLSARAAGALASAGCDTIEDVARLGLSSSEGRRNSAGKAMSELVIVAGWPPKPRTSIDTIAQALRLAIDNPEEAREAAVHSCRRYVTTVPFSRRSGALRRPPSGAAPGRSRQATRGMFSSGPGSLKHQDAAAHV